MDVSNSTGQNTGYRVLGSGGASPMEGELAARVGLLEPWKKEECRFPIPSGSFRVQFSVDGVEVACATFYKAPELVCLQENELGLYIQPDQPEPTDKTVS